MSYSSYLFSVPQMLSSPVKNGVDNLGTLKRKAKYRTHSCGLKEIFPYREEILATITDVPQGRSLQLCLPPGSKCKSIKWCHFPLYPKRISYYPENLDKHGLAESQNCSQVMSIRNMKIGIWKSGLYLTNIIDESTFKL